MQLEKQISAAKKMYAETLHNLEKISDEIHSQRHQERRQEKKAQKLARAAGNETTIYHPLMDMHSSSSDDDSGNETSGDADSAELAAPPLIGAVAVKNITVRQIDCVPVPNTSGQLPVVSSVPVDTVKPSMVAAVTQLNSQQTETSMEKPISPADAESRDLSSSIQRTWSVAESTSPVSPESDMEQIQANAAVMAAISRSKLQRVTSPFLRPDSCREDLSVNGGSETESVSGSFVSGGLCALDDDQIQSLMVDDTDYQRIVADMDAAESDQYQQMALPARLRHLQDFVKFEPVWIDDDGDDAEVVVAAAENADAPCRGTETTVADDHVFASSESVEFINAESHSSGHQGTSSTLDKKDCEADDMWHPLMDNISSTTTPDSSTGHE